MTSTSNEPTPGGLRVVRATSLEAMADDLARQWSTPPADPFGIDLAVVPGPGVQRWLAQRIATRPDREGICAGIEFLSPRGLKRLLRGPCEDPWEPARAVWTLHRIIEEESADPRLEPLRRHLRACREPYTTLHRIALRFADYAEWRPAMIEAWREGQDVDAGGAPLQFNAWQPHLWRLLHDQLGGADPVAADHLARQRLAETGLSGRGAPRLAVVAPEALSPADLRLMTALGARQEVALYLLTPTPSLWPEGSVRLGPRRTVGTRVARHPLNALLGRQDADLALVVRAAANESRVIDDPPRRPENLLGWLQADLAGDLAPTRRILDASDTSLCIHRSHGLDRQVEVLRDALADLLSADPTLEPRDIAVICPDLDAAGPLITAAFGLLADEADQQHPAHRFRVQVADRSSAQTNPLVPLLLLVLRLGDARLEASALLDLCSEPAVARRFGFGPDSHDRLTELVNKGGVRWGLNAAHRSRFGLPGFRQNTWTAGLQRLLLGVTLSEEDLVAAGTVLPVDDVDSSDVELLGGLAELVGRLGRLLTEFELPAPLPQWLDRCRLALEWLVSVPPQEEWQLGDVLAGLARIQERCQAAPGTGVNAATVVRVIEEEFRSRPARPAFGSGALVVSGMSSLRRVPHRVVCLLGWDTGRYPRAMPRDGDDLLRALPWTGDPSPVGSDRQALLDAILAARDHLLIVFRGRSEASNDDVPPPTPLAELIEAIDRTARSASGAPASAQVVVDHPLQPFDPSYFNGSRRRSYDRVGLAGAVALSGPRKPRPDPLQLSDLPEPDLADGLSLDDLAAFYAHPVRHLLRTRTGVSLDEERTGSDDIPIELDHLERWKIGSRALDLARRGFPPDLVARAEWLRGEVPPSELGRRVVDTVVQDVGKVMDRVARTAAAEEATHHDLVVSLPHGPLSGRVTTQGGTILNTEFSGLQSRHKLSAWIRLLALCAAAAGPWRATTITKTQILALNGPDPALARSLLAALVEIYRFGMRRPLPLPPRVCETYTMLRGAGRDPHDPTFRRLLERPWNFDRDATWEAFFAFPDLLHVPAHGCPVRHPGERTLLGVLARSVWEPLLAHEEPR